MKRNGADIVNASRTNSDSRETLLSRHWPWVVLLTIASISAIFFFNDEGTKIKVVDILAKPKKNCKSVCYIHKELHREKWGPDISNDIGSMIPLLNISFLLNQAEHEKSKVIDQLNENYGKEYAQALFFNTTNHGFVSPPNDISTSRHKFVRKLMLKILRVQQAVKDENKDVKGCNCLSSEEDSTSNMRSKESLSSRHLEEEEKISNKRSDIHATRDYYSKFVWSTGGHSASAAHGNYHDESYTKVMERTVKDIFAAVGIEFEGRNYAMGTMDSAPQLALCTEAIYGLDADLISWDFGMIDGREFWKTYMYGSRVGLHRNRPLFVRIRSMINDGIVSDLEKCGLPSMTLEKDAWHLIDQIPDTEGLTQNQIDGMPPFLSYMKCGNHELEKGEPCIDHKYSPSIPGTCELSGQVGWHEGWKVHALNGNIMALFMIELLIDAIKQIRKVAQSSVEFPNTQYIDMLYRNLTQGENDDYETLRKSNISTELTSSSRVLNDLKEDFEGQFEEVKDILYRGKSLCHTAILPAHSRFRGFVTEHSNNSSIDNFDVGLTHDDALTRNDTGIQLVSTHGYLPHGQSPNCTRTVNIDFKDYFIIRHKDGDVHVTLPNKAEDKAYLGSSRLNNIEHGIVVICLPICVYGRCPPGNLMWKDGNRNETDTSTVVENGDVSISINGQIATKSNYLSQKKEDKNQRDGCNILINKDNGYFWNANKDGQFVVRTRVNTADHFFRVSSFIVAYI